MKKMGRRCAGQGLRLWLGALKRRLAGGPHVYLASREDIHHVHRLLAGMPKHAGATYVGIIGGLGTLNYIEALAPARIVLVDVSRDQVEYGRCLLDLIRLSATRGEFVENFFSRPYFPDETVFLGRKGDMRLFDRTLSRVEDPRAFRRYFPAIRDAEAAPGGLRVRGNDFCRLLRLSGPSRGTPQGENSLYFGRGWLRDGPSYVRLRSILARAEVTLIRASIGTVDLKTTGGAYYFHGSNVLESAPGAQGRFLARMHQKLASLDRDTKLISFSTYHPLSEAAFRAFRPLGKDAHSDCAAKVAAYTRGRDVLEVVPGDHSFGRELQARSLEVRRFRCAGPERRYEVVVSHILYGAGLVKLSRRSLFRLWDEWLDRSERLVVVEHNRDSLDFRGGRRLAVSDLAAYLGSRPGIGCQMEFSLGQRDRRRNMILCLGRIGSR